jgi:hypothetical protein
MRRPYVCHDCGVLVFRKDFHSDFHERFRETTRILGQVIEHLQLIDGSQ